MTLRHLKIFVTVCECGSTTKASEKLYIAQPTISHTITELEKYYKVALFERINQRLILTDIGRELLAKAKEILAGFEDFESLASFKGHSPKVKIGSSLTLGQTVIPYFCRKIEDEYPYIQLQVVIAPYDKLEREIESGNLDFAIVEEAVSSPALKTVPFKRDELAVVAHSDFDAPNSLDISELAQYPLLLREKGNASRDVLEKMLSHIGIHVQPRIDSVNNQAIITATYACLGISVLPESFVRGHIERGNLKKIQLDGLEAVYTNYIVIHKNKKLNDIQQQAYDVLKNMQV